MTNENQSNSVPERLQSILQDIGYRAQVEGEILVISAAGTKSSLRYYDGGSIQIAFGLSEFPEQFDDEKINSFNSKYRFGTVYRQGRNLFLHSNFILNDPFSEDVREELEMIMGIYEGLVATLRLELGGAEKDEDQAPEA